MNIAYVRVSTVEQNDERQREALAKHDIKKWFSEKISGKDTHRPKLQEMLDFAREGDTVFVHDFSRLARSTKDLLGIIDQLNSRGVRLVSNKENLDSTTPTGKLMLTMIGAINEFERTNMLERQREGVAIAKREGKFKGGVEKNPRNFDECYKEYIEKHQTKTELAKALKVSRTTLNKILERKGLE